MSQSYLEALMAGRAVNPLHGLLGLEVVKVSDRQVQMHLPYRRELEQGAGSVAGGVLALVADEAMAHVVLAGLDAEMTCVTVEMQTRFLRAPLPCDVQARAQIIKRGSRLVVAEAELFQYVGADATCGGAALLGEERPNETDTADAQAEANERLIVTAQASFMVQPRSD